MSDLRSKIIEAMARAMFDCYHGYNAETRREMFMRERWSLERKAERALNAIGEHAAVVPREATPQILAGGWTAINKGRTRPVDMAPGPALREAWPAMIAAADLTRPGTGEAPL